MYRPAGPDLPHGARIWLPDAPGLPVLVVDSSGQPWASPYASTHKTAAWWEATREPPREEG